jgi:hypothetical protein
VKVANKVLLGTAVGAGMLALSAASASATIVCSGNVCWHTTAGRPASRLRLMESPKPFRVAEIKTPGARPGVSIVPAERPL